MLVAFFDWVQWHFLFLIQLWYIFRSFVLTHSFIYAFLLWDRRLVVEATGCQSTAHIVPHVTRVGGLGDVLLLESFA